MDKLKNIFKPGHSQQDQTMSGDQGSGNVTSEQDPGAMLKTDPGVDKKDHSVLRQILNPGGEKYEDLRYGTTAHADNPINAPSTGTETSTATNAPQIESQIPTSDRHGLARQMLNPGGEKFDDTRYGETGKIVPGSEPIPSGTSSTGMGNTAAGPTGATDQPMPGSGPERSRYTGATARDTAVSGAAGAGTAALLGHEGTLDPARTMAPSHCEDTASAPTTVSAGPGTAQGIDEASKSHAQTMNPSGVGARDHALAAGFTEQSTKSTFRPQNAYDPAASASIESTHVSSSVREAARQETIPVAPGQLGESVSSRHQDRLGHDAALVGGAAAIGTGGLVTNEHESEAQDDMSGATHTARSYYLGAAPGGHRDDEKPVEGYVHHTQGPHALDVANRLDPHVPGEFPDESGEDPHKNLGGIGAAFGMSDMANPAPKIGKADQQSIVAEPTQPTGSSPLGTDASRPTGSEHSIATVTNTMPSLPKVIQVPNQNQQHISGQDAAAAGSLDASGLTEYDTGRIPHHGGHATAPLSAPLSSSAQPSSTAGRVQPQDRYGRDATAGAAVGAVGAGAGAEAHALTKNRAQERPHSQAKEQLSGQTQAGAILPSRQGLPSSMQTAPQIPERQHAPHDGSDAHLGGQIGGAAAASASDIAGERNRTAIASKTAGPHDGYLRDDLSPLHAQEEARRHDGRDFPVAGDFDQGGAGVYDAEKAQEKDKAAAKAAAPSKQAALVGRSQQPEHYGRDANNARGVDSASLGPHEADKANEEHKATHEVPTPSQATPANQAQDHQGHHEHNKLHKRNDPRYYQDKKHEQELQKAREEEAAAGGDHHEKKPGLLARILHPVHKDKHEEHSNAHEEPAHPGAVAAARTAAGAPLHEQPR